MRIRRAARLDTTILGSTSLLAIAMGGSGAGTCTLDPPAGRTGPPEPSALVGAWLSADGTVRLVLRPDLTYDLSVAGRDRTAHGTYHLDGADLQLRDDDGLRTPARTGAADLIEMAGYDLHPV